MTFYSSFIHALDISRPLAARRGAGPWGCWPGAHPASASRAVRPEGGRDGPGCGGAGRPAAGAQPGPKQPGLTHLPRERDPLSARLCIPEPLGLMDGFGEFPANPHGIILLHAVAVGGMGLNRDPLGPVPVSV